MTSSKRAFTLIEMLVVVGIIGILAGVLFASFGGATESARAAQCLTNMRALAMAANSRAMATEYYPFAGSLEVKTMDGDGSFWFLSKPGWISWLCEGKYDDGRGHARSQSHQNNEIFAFFGVKTDDPNQGLARFALTNGNLWVACNRNAALYTCPEHVLYRKDKKGTGKTYFSYVMNGRFGWDYTEGAGSIVMCDSREGLIDYGKLGRADKTLMFAELPTKSVGGTAKDSADEDEKSDDDKDVLRSDGVLQYLDVRASGSNEKDPFAVDGAKAEAIGFVHKVGKKKRCAHVAFADGHTEKLVWSPGGTDAVTLTAYLCKGWDVTSSPGGGWALAQDADKAE